jgi:hypothetical protein
MTLTHSILAVNPNKDIIEDRKQKESFSIKGVGDVLGRTRMFLFYCDWIIDIDDFIVQF